MEIGPTREHAGSRDRGRYSCSVIFELKLEMVLGWETRSAFNRKSIWLNLQNRNSGECFAARIKDLVPSETAPRASFPCEGPTSRSGARCGAPARWIATMSMVAAARMTRDRKHQVLKALAPPPPRPASRRHFTDTGQRMQT